MGFEIINALKKEKGLTNAQIAKMSGVTLSTLDKITSGVNTNPKLDTLQAICNVLGCTLNDFMTPSPENKKSPGTDESVPRNELEREVIRLAGNLSDEQKDFFLALLRLTAARNQGLSAADLVSAGEAVLKAGHRNPTH